MDRYSGNSGNSGNSGVESFKYHGRMKFTTYDRDNDANSTGNGASNYNGGFWFNELAVCIATLTEMSIFTGVLRRTTSRQVECGCCVADN